MSIKLIHPSHCCRFANHNRSTFPSGHTWGYGVHYLLITVLTIQCRCRILQFAGLEDGMVLRLQNQTQKGRWHVRVHSYVACSPETCCEYFCSYLPGGLVLKKGGDFWWIFCGLRFPGNKTRKTLEHFRENSEQVLGAKFVTKNRKIRGTFVLQLFWPSTFCVGVNKKAHRATPWVLEQGD